MAGKSNSDGRSRKRLPPLTGGRRKSCFFCKSKVDEIDYKNVGELRRYISEKGKIRSRRISGACRRHQRQVPWRSSARARWRSCRTSPRAATTARAEAAATAATATGTAGATMQVVLRQDVDNLGLRGEVVNVARGYARNFLLPRGLAEPATPGLVRELERRDAERARHEAQTVDEAQAIANAARGEPSFDSTSTPARPGRCSARSPRRTSPTSCGRTTKIRVDRRKVSMDSIKRIGRYTVPVERLRRRHGRAAAARRARGRRASARGGARAGGRGRAGRGGSRGRGAARPPARRSPTRSPRRTPRRSTAETAEDDELARPSEPVTGSPAERRRRVSRLATSSIRSPEQAFLPQRSHSQE